MRPGSASTTDKSSLPTSPQPSSLSVLEELISRDVSVLKGSISATKTKTAILERHIAEIEADTRKDIEAIDLLQEENMDLDSHLEFQNKEITRLLSLVFAGCPDFDCEDALAAPAGSTVARELRDGISEYKTALSELNTYAQQNCTARASAVSAAACTISSCSQKILLERQTLEEIVSRNAENLCRQKIEMDLRQKKLVVKLKEIRALAISEKNMKKKKRGDICSSAPAATYLSALKDSLATQRGIYEEEQAALRDHAEQLLSDIKKREHEIKVVRHRRKGLEQKIIEERDGTNTEVEELKKAITQLEIRLDTLQSD